MFDENARGTNLLDTGAHFYDVYRCSDGKFISLGSIEPQFYAELLRLTGLDGDDEFAKQMDPTRLDAPEGAAHRGLRPTDAGRVVRDDGDDRRLLRPDPDDERSGGASAQRRAPTFVEVDGVRAAGPRAAVQPDRHRRSSVRLRMPVQHTRDVLADWGLSAERVDELIASAAVRQAE